MTDKPIHDPEVIRRHCAGKLRSIETSGMFTAIDGCLLAENWSAPSLTEMRIMPDRCLLGRVGDDPVKAFLGGGS